MDEAVEGGTVTTIAFESSGDVDEGIDVLLVRRIADTLGRDPTDLVPLAWVVDPDALGTLAANDRASVSFEYEGCDVRIDREGRVTVSVREAETESTTPS